LLKVPAQQSSEERLYWNSPPSNKTIDDQSTIVFVIVFYSKTFYSATQKLSAGHQLIHERCDESKGLCSTCRA